MSRRGPWRTLGIDPTEDRAAIRRAYAGKLKALDLDREIEAYARLRDARDHALALAAGLEPAAEIDGEELWADGDAEDGGEALPLDGEPVPSGEETVPHEPTAPEIFLAILFPQGEQSDEPLSHAEAEAAAGALAGIIHEAHEATIDQHRVIEEWVAHHLASAWPRSAPLLEQAAAAFEWLDEVGRLSERPAIAYLNTRLRGMRFHAKVQEPGHPLHKAWTELSRPGDRGLFGFMRAGKSDVRLLLDGIRERYPEVEGHLDPVRVASWETASEVTPSSAWTSFFLLAGAAALVRVCAGALDSSPAPLPPPVVVSPPASVMGSVGWSRDERVLLIHELFGEPILPDTLRNEAPDLWSFLESGPQSDDPIPNSLFANDIDAALPSLVQQVRLQTQLAAIDADLPTLVAIKQIKLELLRVAWTQGGAQVCLDFSRTLRFPPESEVPPGIRDRERKLASHLVENGLFRRTTNQFPQSASIPGSVVEEVMRTTGFSEETTAAAAQNRGSAAIQCEYRIAVLEAVLQRPLEVPPDLLRLL